MVLALAPGAAFGLDVSVEAPEIHLNTGISAINDTTFQDQLNTELQTQAGDLETDLATTELNQYDDQPLLAEGFANAGASSAHLGTQRSFSDYDLFAVTLGTGAAVSAPGVELAVIGNAAEDIEDEGDL